MKRYACPSCGYSGSTMGYASFVKPGVRCLKCDDAEYEEYVPVSQLQGAVEALRHILESAEHPSLTVRSTEYIARVARDALDRLADASRAIQRPEEGTDA